MAKKILVSVSCGKCDDSQAAEIVRADFIAKWGGHFEDGLYIGDPNNPITWEKLLASEQAKKHK